MLNRYLQTEKLVQSSSAIAGELAKIVSKHYWQCRNYNISGPPANIRYGLTVLIHNSGDFGPPLPFSVPASPGIAGAADG